MPTIDLSATDAAPAAPDAPAGPPPAPPVPFAFGLLAERYELLGELGQGGMAAVYRARERGPDGALGREVAVKVVRSRYAADADAMRRFAREARTVAGLDHPNVVRTLATEELGGVAVAIVSEYVHGRTLREVLNAAGGPLPFDQAAAVLRDLAAALAYAHGRRIVHRDVKPENAFVRADGRTLLADFGIALPLDTLDAPTLHGALGTPVYMAPEQIAGRVVDERTDVYGLALVGWELIAGRRPWQGEPLSAVLHKQQFEPLPDLAAVRPDIPAYLLAAVQGGLAKDPAGRWRDGAEFLARLTPQPLVLPTVRPTVEEATVSGDVLGTTSGATPAEPTIRVALGGAGDEGAGTEVLAPPRRRLGRRRTLALAALGAAALASAGVALGTRPSRADDAAVTGVSDAELQELLRDAADAAAARSAARPTPPTAPQRGLQGGLQGGPQGGPPGRLTPTAARSAGPAAARPTPTAEAPTARVPAPSRTAAASGEVAGPRSPLRMAVAPADAQQPAPAPAQFVSETPTTLPAPGDAPADARCASPSRADQTACLLAGVTRNDRALTVSYQALIADLRTRAGGEREPPAVQALRARQRAWVDARDRQCRSALAGREGPLWGAARVPCFAALSARRAAELDARRARLGGA